MDILGLFWAMLEHVLHEAALFAACGFLLLGAGDLAVDLIWLALLARRGRAAERAEGLPVAERPGRLAIFTPAWDESAVIGEMLAHAQAAFAGGDYVLYVGCYPNDPATIGAVRAAAGPRVRLVIGPAPGPTSKADCLNRHLGADARGRGRATGSASRRWCFTTPRTWSIPPSSACSTR